MRSEPHGVNLSVCSISTDFRNYTNKKKPDVSGFYYLSIENVLFVLNIIVHIFNSLVFSIRNRVTKNRCCNEQ